jgi:hypothetical protein
MKKLILTLLCSLITLPAFAGPHHHHRHHGYHTWHHNHNWVAPAIIGGVIGYSIARPYIVEQPIIVQQPTVISQPTVQCTEWREIMTQDGRIVQERTCRQ